MPNFFTYTFILLAVCFSFSISQAQVLDSKTQISNVDFMIQTGMYQEALNLLIAHLTEFPYDEAALSRRIHVHAILGNDDLKMRDIETVSLINPLFALKYSIEKRANIIRLPQVDYSPFANERSFKKNVFDLELLNTMYEKHAGEYYLEKLELIVELLAEGKLTEALDHKEFDQADNEFQVVHYDLLAVIHVLLEEPQKSLSYVEEALSLNPVFSLARHHKSLIYQSLGRFDEALNEIDVAISIDQDVALYYFTKAQLLEAMDRRDEAISYYKLSMDIKDNYTESQINIGRLLVSMGEADRGIKYIKQAAWGGNDLLIDRKIVGINSFINGDYDKAVKEFEFCLDAAPENPTIIYNLAISYIAKGEHDIACEILDLINKEDFNLNKNVLDYCSLQ